MNEYEQIDIDIKKAIDELKSHMVKENESLELPADEEVEEVYSMKAKLTHKAGDRYMWLVPSEQDWLHDAMDDFEIIPGTVHAADAPFLPNSIEVDGYFQADEDGRWIRVQAGRAEVEGEGTPNPWVNDLNEFPEVVEQLEEAMKISAYRHAVEKATLRVYK